MNSKTKCRLRRFKKNCLGVLTFLRLGLYLYIPIHIGVFPHTKEGVNAMFTRIARNEQTLPSGVCISF
jgi:hypothetical protein